MIGQVSSAPRQVSGTPLEEQLLVPQVNQARGSLYRIMGIAAVYLSGGGIVTSFTMEMASWHTEIGRPIFIVSIGLIGLAVLCLIKSPHPLEG